MSKLQKRILQGLALSLLLLIQILSVYAEREVNDMPAQIPQASFVIKKHQTIAHSSHRQSHAPVQRHKHHRKLQSAKHITIKFSTPEKTLLTITPRFDNHEHNFSYSEQYSYIYYNNINPPPPKA